MPRSSPLRLTPSQRDEIIRRVQSGEKGSAIAREFGVTRSYVSFLKISSQVPKVLTEDEQAQISRTLAKSTPEKEGLLPAVDRWRPDHVRQLITQRYKKNPGIRAIQNLFSNYFLSSGPSYDAKPQPPRPRQANQIPAELAENPEFVAYYLSPLAWQIAQREFEIALKEWEKRHPEVSKTGAEGQPSLGH